MKHKLTNLEVFSLFSKFLKENNAEENYKKYCGPDIGSLVSVRYDLICHFFDWKKTDEGWKYWAELNKKWNKLLKQVEDEH